MRTHQPRWTAHRTQAGVSLLEVLITVLVISLGLLGLAGLQMTALRNNQSALQRSTVVMESYSIIDVMRVDRPNALGGAYNLAIDATDPASGSFANNELTKWRGRLRVLLGTAATGAVACNLNACTVTVRWDDRRGTSGAEQQLIVTQALI